MKAKYVAMCGASLIALLPGCATRPVSIAPVGPTPTGQPTAFVPTGRLQVFSDTETHEIGENTVYYPHTSYNIHDQSGKIVEYVPNHTGVMDGSPSTVSIPAGQYNVVAESSSYGRVTVPVVIEGGKTTVVHLDREWQPAAKTPSNDLVYLPDGEAVGWKELGSESARNNRLSSK